MRSRWSHSIYHQQGVALKFSDSTKALVRQRTGMVCDRCGIRVMHPHYHHRRPRGMGGSAERTTGMASNALLLHPACHEWIEKNRAESASRGWIVRSWEQPQDVACFIHGDWVLLQPDGSAIITADAAGSGRGSLPGGIAVPPHDEVADVDSASTGTASEQVPLASPF